MTDNRARRTAQGLGIAAAASLVAAVLTALPGTQRAEGTVYHSYQDAGGVWTACTGHTGPDIHAGMTFTPPQCADFLKADLTKATRAVEVSTPILAEKPGVLAVAGDFAFNAGPGRWLHSPMRRDILAGKWQEGCNAFAGYMTLYRAPRTVPGRKCQRNALGTLYCELPGLVTRRKNEREQCLKGL